VAEATASLLKVFSGWLPDVLRQRKWLAVAGYAASALAKPFFYVASSWQTVAAVRWADRIGKGIRTAPRDALVADSVPEEQRGLAFGLHRAADTAGAMLGILFALVVVWHSQGSSGTLRESTFRTVVLLSLLPAVLAVLSLTLGAKDVRVVAQRAAPKFAFRSLGRPFVVFMLIVGLFDVGNSSDAFLILRAQERGLNAVNVLAMLAAFNLVYTLVSTPAGALSDRIGRHALLVGGWLLYALIYLGFALATHPWHICCLWRLLRADLWHGQGHGCRCRTPGSQGHCLRHLQRGAWPAGLSRFTHRWPALGRFAFPGLCGIWGIGAVLLRGDDGPAGGPCHDRLEAQKRLVCCIVAWPEGS